MSDQVGVAIIGSGIFVKEQHLPAILATPTLHLKALYSRTLTTAQTLSATLPDPTTIDLYSSDSPPAHTYDALLARPDIPALLIALPIPHQPHFITRALHASKHVLAEKPLAPDLPTAHALLATHHASASLFPAASAPTFGIAEQFRYFDAFQYAAAQARTLGRVLGFRHRFGASVEPGGKYYETGWRKTPAYQGGFLLDGGVHFAAGMRMLLGEAKVARVSAFTTRAQEHLAPVDTVEATVRLEGGGVGGFGVSFGTTFRGACWEVACEGGSVRVEGKTVTVVPKGGEGWTVERAGEEGGSGVPAEVRAWGRGLVRGELEGRQRAEEALADLECVEAMLRSGESGGEPVDLRYQI